MEKVKVLHLITHLGFGGASDNTLLTVKELSRTRYEVHLGAGADYVDWVEQGREYADAFVMFPNLYRSPRPLADLCLLWQLYRFFRAHQYDIVHTHNAKAGVLGRLAAYLAGVPIILHSMHLLSWQDMEADRTGFLKRLKAWVQERIYFWLEKFAAALSDQVITVSQLNREEAAQAGLAPLQKLTVVYSGIEYDRFQVHVNKVEKCRQLGLDADRPIVGMIGRLSPQKAPLDFVAAAKLVLQKRPDAQFIVVGEGPLAAEVKAAVGAEARIHLLGYRDDVPELLTLLDIFALSSLWEGLGRALTEAMSVGIPVAVTAVNGVPEIVHHGDTGLLSSPAAPEQLANNICWLLDHPNEAASMAQRGQEEVLPHFGAQQMIDQIEAIYETFLLQKSRKLPVRREQPVKQQKLVDKSQ